CRMNVLRVLVLLVALLGVRSAANAVSWSPNLKLKSVEATRGGWVWLHFEQTFDCDNTGLMIQSAIVSAPATSAEENAVNRMHSAALAAFLAGREVTLRVEKQASSNICVIERIIVK